MGSLTFLWVSPTFQAMGTFDVPLGPYADASYEVLRRSNMGALTFLWVLLTFQAMGPFDVPMGPYANARYEVL